VLQRGGILPEHELHHLLDDVMPALEAVHGQGYLHRDLKPSNLYIRSADARVMLIDFGAARQALGQRTRSVTSVVTPGYSPIEQYVTVGEDYGPWTDIYALGAVLYRCITGAPPLHHRSPPHRGAGPGAQRPGTARCRMWRRPVFPRAAASGRPSSGCPSRGSLPDHRRHAGSFADRGPVK